MIMRLIIAALIGLVGINSAFASAVVNHHVPESASSDRPLTLKVRFEESVTITTVTLYYRAKGEKQYQSKLMVSNDKGDYETQLSVNELRVGAIEYYFRAVDEKGRFISRPAKRFPYQLAIQVVDEQPRQGKQPQSTAETHVPQAPPPQKKGYWKWIVGSLAVGAVAAAAGGGGGDDTSAPPTPTGIVSFSNAPAP